MAPRRTQVEQTVLQEEHLPSPLLSARALVVQGEDQGASVPLGAGVVIVGTEPGCGLVLRDRAVSKRHLSLERVGSAVRLRDLGSTNGTLVGSARIVESLVPVGTMVRVGRTWLHLQGQEGGPVIEPSELDRMDELVGGSPAMRQLYAVLSRVAGRDVTVFVDGETGTGKELVARALHARSARAKGPLVVFDCSAVSPDLVEAQLFGHRRGAFTGAAEDRPGVFEAASGGTLFLDELDSLPLSVQPKLLRALESRRVVRLGEHLERGFDVRIIAAAGRSPEDAVAAGALRRDLYFRLAVVRITLPALRDRLEDLASLVEVLLERIGARVAVTEGPALARLRSSSWPGNVRELRNVLERAWALAPEGASTLDELPLQVGPMDGARGVEADPLFLELPYEEARDRVIERWQAVYLRAAIDRAGGNLSAAAREIGMSRLHLRRLLREHGLWG